MTQKRLKLCVLIPAHWEAIMGGSQYQVKILLDRLIPTGKYDIYYLARRIKPDFHPKGYTIIKIGDPNGIGRYAHFFDGLKILRTLNEIKPDIIYQYVGCSYTGIAAYYSVRSGCNMVWRIASEVDVQPWNRLISRNMIFNFFEKKILEYGIRRARFIVGQTRYQGQFLERHYGRKLSALVPNFHPFPKESIQKTDPVKVLWVANVKRLKQPQVFIQLARDLQDIENVRFIMIGLESYEEAWQAKLVSEIDAINNLSYLGGLPQSEVNKHLSESHILINTSEYEGFSNTFIQAWMRRVPVVSLNVNPDDVFKNGRLGYCADGDYLIFRQHVKNLVEDSVLRETLSKQTQDYAFKHHSEKNMDVLVDLLGK